jgi:8-oxo-dGTP pyrophosphatase MutT (NUDIX family)
MISDKKFPGFNSNVNIAGCFVEHDGKILLIKRANGKHQNSKWSVPGGKMEKGETEIQGAIRETFEETGVKLNPKKVVFIEKTYVRFSNPDFEFTYTYFRCVLDGKDKPKIVLNKTEHTEYKWITPKDALKEDLMQDEDYCIKRAYNV